MATNQPIADTLTEAGLSGTEVVELEVTQPQQDEPISPDAAASDWVIRRPKRADISAEESLRRMQAFPEREEKFVAAVRKSKS